MMWARQVKIALTTIGTRATSLESLILRLYRVFEQNQVQYIPGLYRGNMTARQWT
jgi:hypothetical protein